MKTILPLLLALSLSGTVSAQGPFGVPGGGIPALGAGQPGQADINYQGMPQAFQAWPGLSPYEYASQQTVNDGGLWFSENINHFGPKGSLYTFDLRVEWLNNTVRKLDGRVGDPNAQFLVNLDDNALLTPEALEYRMFFPPSLSRVRTVRPQGFRVDASLKSRDGWRFSVNSQYNPLKSETFSAQFDRAQYRIDEVDALLLEATGGIGNPALILTNQRQTSDLEIAVNIILNRPGAAGDVNTSVPEDPLVARFDAGGEESFGVRGSTSDILDRILIPQVNVPLQDGSMIMFPPSITGLFENDFQGVYQRFDLEVAIRHEIQSFSAGAQVETAPLFEKIGVQFRGIVGGRYVQIKEGFHFFGMDSGLEYDSQAGPELYDRVDNDNDFVIDEVDEGGGGGDYTGFNPSRELLIRSFVDNVVESDLAGPEFGLAYDLGRRVGVKLTGSSRIGALVNRETVSLAGDNIGQFTGGEISEDEVVTVVIPGVGDEEDVEVRTLSDLFDTTTTNGQLTQNAFSDINNSKHVSAMFEQTVDAEIPLFNRIPVLQDVRLLEDATLNVGYTFLWIDDVADPSQSINWTSNPRMGLFPTVNVQRSDFYQHTFRLGVNCPY